MHFLEFFMYLIYVLMPIDVNARVQIYFKLLSCFKCNQYLLILYLNFISIGLNGSKLSWLRSFELFYF